MEIELLPAVSLLPEKLSVLIPPEICLPGPSMATPLSEAIHAPLVVGVEYFGWPLGTE
jgi:hypothetical protein